MFSHELGYVTDVQTSQVCFDLHASMAWSAGRRHTAAVAPLLDRQTSLTLFSFGLAQLRDDKEGDRPRVLGEGSPQRPQDM